MVTMIVTLLALFSYLIGPGGGDALQEDSCPSNPNPEIMASPRERTFLMIKPDGVQRGLVGKIIQRFEEKGFKLVAMKMMVASKDHLRVHYKDLASRPFFNSLVDYMSSGPVVPMVWEGIDVVRTSRRMLGETNPMNANPGTIRGDFAVQVGRNVCHGSDSVESAQREIALWFKTSAEAKNPVTMAEVVGWNQVTDGWINTAN